MKLRQTQSAAVDPRETNGVDSCARCGAVLGSGKLGEVPEQGRCPLPQTPFVDALAAQLLTWSLAFASIAASAAAADGAPASLPQAGVPGRAQAGATGLPATASSDCRPAMESARQLGPCDGPDGSASSEAASWHCLAGTKAFLAADYEQAMRRFSELERLEPGGQSAFRLALTAEMLGRYYEARDRLRAALDARDSHPLSTSQRGEAERRRGELEAYLKKLELRTDAVDRDDVRGVLHSSTALYQLRPSALTQKLVAHAALDAREYELAAFAAGRALEDARVPLTTEERSEVIDVIAEAGKALLVVPVRLSHPAGEKMTLSIEPARANARGMEHGNDAPLLSFETAEPASCAIELALRTGEWLVRGSAPGRAAVTTTIQVAPDAKPTPVLLQIGADASPVALERPRWVRPVSLAALGAGSAALAAAAIASGLSYAKHQESDRDCIDGCGPNGVTAMDAAIVAGNVATASWILTGVGLGTATVLWLGYVRRKPKQRERSQWTGMPTGLRARW